MSRWPCVTGLWLLVPAWLYAALAALELRDLDHDPTAPGQGGYARVADQVPILVDATAATLAVVLLLGVGSLATGRLRRTTDLALAAGLGLAATMLWAVDEPRPVAPLLLAGAAVVLVVSAALPQPGRASRLGTFSARLLLATAALLAGWVLLHQLDAYHWQLRSWTVGYWLGLMLAVAMLLAALLGRRLAHPAWRWLVGVPLGLVAVLVVASGVAGLRGGYLVSGFEENETGWSLGGPPLFLGTGLLAASLAALRGRWPLAAGTAGAAVLAVLGLLFGIPEIRSGY